MPKHLMFAALLGMRFNQDPAGPPGGGTTPPATTEPPATPPAATPPAPTPPAPSGDFAATEGQSLIDLIKADPEKTEREIRRLRSEALASRTEAKTAAADEARNAIVQELGKALGLVTDGEPAPTPEQVTAQVAAAQDAARQSAIELAIYRTAAVHSGNPTALTDSRTFMDSVRNLDPTAGDFTTKVIDAAKAAVTANTSLKAAPVAGASGVDHPGGTGERPKQSGSLTAAVNQHYTQ